MQIPWMAGPGNIRVAADREFIGKDWLAFLAEAEAPARDPPAIQNLALGETDRTAPAETFFRALP